MDSPKESDNSPCGNETSEYDEELEKELLKLASDPPEAIFRDVKGFLKWIRKLENGG